MRLLKTRAYSPVEIQYADRIHQQYLDDTIPRLILFSVLLAFGFAAYGYSSLHFIQKFRPDVTLWANVWPRLLFNSLPLLATAYFLKHSSWSSFTKIILWQFLICGIFDAAAAIYVWPIALSGHSEILLHVNATNTSMFAAIIMMQSLPLREMLLSLGVLFSCAWVPLGIIAWAAGDPIVARTVIGDIAFLEPYGFAFAYTIYHARRLIALNQIEREVEASKFLGPAVSRAIFQGQQHILQSQLRRGFVICIDIRDSTEMQKKHGFIWLNFRKEYFAHVGKTVEYFGGYIQKTTGDCHIINFGIMDDSADLSDIPGLERENASVDEKRLKAASDSAIECVERIFGGFQKLAGQHFPLETLSLGAGIDKGVVERGIQGAHGNLELDVNGDPVNCASRLQDYSKLLKEDCAQGSSVLVISPFASDYLSKTKTQQFKRAETSAKPIRNYPQIRWVLVREFKNERISARSEAA